MKTIISNRCFEIKHEDNKCFIDFNQRSRDPSITLRTFIKLLTKSNIDTDISINLHFNNSDEPFHMYICGGQLFGDIDNLYNIAGNRIILTENTKVKKTPISIIIDVFLKDESCRGYLLYKKCVASDNVLYTQRPKFGTLNLPKLIEYIDGYCNFICETGDDWFSSSKNLTTYTENGEYIIESEDGSEQIIFTIVPTYWWSDTNEPKA